MRKLFAVVFVALLAAWSFGWSQQVSVKVAHAPLRGRVVVRPVRELPRFHQPVIAVPTLMPTAIEGRVWRWHRSIGWVGLEAGAAPAEILLPENFALPAQVPYYQAEAAPPCILTCPHCGQPITLTAR